MHYFEWAVSALSMLLQALTLSALIRGRFRSYPLVFLLILTELLGTVIGLAATLDSGWTKQTARYFWMMEAFEYALIYACLVQLLAQSVGENQTKRPIAFVILAGLVFAGLSAAQAYHPRTSYWMTQLVRNFSFGSMILTLTIWTQLLRKPNKERLLVTAGIGIQLAGGAIGHSLNLISPKLVALGNVVLSLVYLLSLYMIWKALAVKEIRQVATEPAGGVTSTPDHSNQLTSL
ncbi:MAG: hypothetical protein HYZ37_03500 [Candidatus Solibacter usitatus]|nr:hypothetical protein [Candidatus Solibacter usitatus]